MEGVFFVKKVENKGVFCKKSGPFLIAGCISISIFYFTFYLFWGSAYGPGVSPVCSNAELLTISIVIFETVYTGSLSFKRPRVEFFVER